MIYTNISGRLYGSTEDSSEVSTALRCNLIYLELLESEKSCGNFLKILGPGLVISFTSSLCAGLFRDPDAVELGPLSLSGGVKRHGLMASGSWKSSSTIFLFTVLQAWPRKACVLQPCHNLEHSHDHLRAVERLRHAILSHKSAAHLGALKRHIFLTSFVCKQKGHKSNKEATSGMNCNWTSSSSQVRILSTSRSANYVYIYIYIYKYIQINSI